VRTIIPDPTTNDDQTTTEHPSWCDPRECAVVDHRGDELGSLLRVHAITVWQTPGGRSVQLIQVQVLDGDGLARTYPPVVKGHGDLDVGFEADDAAQLGEAWIRAGRLARTGSLPFTKDWVSERLIAAGLRTRWSRGVVAVTR
jgi:hypothetical protein